MFAICQSLRVSDSKVAFENFNECSVEEFSSIMLNKFFDLEGWEIFKTDGLI